MSGRRTRCVQARAARKKSRSGGGSSRSARRSTRGRGPGIGLRFFMIACVAVTAIAVFTLSQKLYKTQSETTIEVIQRKIAEEHTQQENLRVELAGLESPSRISSIARRKLGMADPGSLIFLNDQSGFQEWILSQRSDDVVRQDGGVDSESSELEESPQEEPQMASVERRVE